MFWQDVSLFLTWTILSDSNIFFLVFICSSDIKHQQQQDLSLSKLCATMYRESDQYFHEICAFHAKHLEYQDSHTNPTFLCVSLEERAVKIPTAAFMWPVTWSVVSSVKKKKIQKENFLGMHLQFLLLDILQNQRRKGFLINFANRIYMLSRML